MKKKQRNWTGREVAQLRELRPAHTIKELAKIMGRTEESIKGATVRFKISSGRTGRFEKGVVAWNKGLDQSDYMSEESIEKVKATQFKPGVIPHNTKSRNGVISVRADGYKWVRIAKAKWELYHREVWRKKHGEIPAGMIVSFKDGNAMNCAIENLELISRAENALRNINREKASKSLSELYRRERIRKKYDLGPISGHGKRIVNYW